MKRRSVCRFVLRTLAAASIAVSANGIPVSASAITVNDRTLGTGLNQFEYVGAWTSGTAEAGCYNNDLTWSNTPGDYFQVRFSDTLFRLYGKLAGHHGSGAISIDNGAETSIIFYSAATVLQALVYTSPKLTSGNHILKVRVVSGYVVPDKVELGEAAPVTFPDYSGVVGTNYTYANAVNEIQFWSEFDTATINRELGWAQAIGLNALRVFLHNWPYDQNKTQFLSRVEKFLAIADRHGIKAVLVFFDDCWYGDSRVFTFTPVKGGHNGRWARCPLDNERDTANYPKFKAYVQEVINARKTDPRVLAWEIWNEPNTSQFTVDCEKNAFAWARQSSPAQPVIGCWGGDQYSDVEDIHNYGIVGNVPDVNRGTLVTEAGCRAWGMEEGSYGSATEWLYWLNSRKSLGQPVPGVFLTWELMAGNSNCTWHWNSTVGDPVPPIPWCGLFYPDGTPVSLAEAEAIRRYTLKDTQAVLFDDFQNGDYNGWQTLSGTWGINTNGNVRDLRSNSGTGAKVIVRGDSAWKNYTVQSTVRLMANSTAGAGMLVRASGGTAGALYGYYCGFSTTMLFLIKITPGMTSILASKAMPAGDFQVTVGVRNSLKAAVSGNNIKIFLNDPRTADIDYTDIQQPLLSGRIGFRATDIEARFDDIAVMLDTSTATGVHSSGTIKTRRFGPNRAFRVYDLKGRLVQSGEHLMPALKQAGQGLYIIGFCDERQKSRGARIIFNHN